MVESKNDGNPLVVYLAVGTGETVFYDFTISRKRKECLGSDNS